MGNREIRKQVTDNPLIDEVVYQCQVMLQGIVLKDEALANKSETLNSIKQSDLYAIIIEGKAKFEYFEYTYDILQRIAPLTKDQCIMYARNNDIIPDELKPALLEIAKEKFLRNYQELNNYYRMLNGLPDVGEEGIYLTSYELNMIGIDDFDISKYVHEMSNAEATILYATGVIKYLLEKYPNRRYLLHLGDKKINPYYARKVPPFGLLYLPAVESKEVSSKFRERLEVNRVFTIKTIYSEAYKFESDYYDRFIILMILLQSFDDMIALTPEYLIQRELFDLRTIEYIFAASGVQFFKEIPLVYQKRLVKNLNRLIKYKSSDKNLIDISSLFGFDDVDIFKYYMMKTPQLDENGEYKNDITEDPKTGQSVPDLESNFELKFLKVPIDKTYDDYIRNRMNYQSYEDIVKEDKYWDGVYTSDYVKHKILEHEFNIVISKYISVDTVYSLTELSFELVYFINMLLYSKVDTSKLTIPIPEVSANVEYPLVDLLICLYSLMYMYNGVKDNIIYDPVQAMAVKGFNFETDMQILSNYVQEQGFTLEELGVNFMKPPKTGILSFNQLTEIYLNNKNIYHHLVKQMNKANDKKIYDIYKTIYESLYITRLNFDYFRKYPVNGKEPQSYSKYLSSKNSSLYDIILTCQYISKESDRQLEISKYINYIVENIYIYLDKEIFRYIFQGIPTVSLDYIRSYMFKVINFFKSYKVDLVNTNSIYKFDDKLDNKIRMIDEIIFKYIFNKNDLSGIKDDLRSIINLNPKENIELLEKIFLDITYWHIYPMDDHVIIFEKIADILIILVKDEYANLDHECIYEYKYIFSKSEILAPRENIDIGSKLRQMSSLIPDDAIYLREHH